MPVTSSMLLGDRAEVAEEDEGLVVAHVVGVHLLAGEPIGMPADDVLRGDEVIEARRLRPTARTP